MFFPTQPTWICFFLRFKMASFWNGNSPFLALS
jgi:hypothetical protein